MQKLAIFLYVVLFRWWLTLFGNVIYWIVHIHKMKLAIAIKRYFRRCAYSIDNVKRILNDYKWVSDPLKGLLDWTNPILLDWSPWPMTIINKGFRDDCDGAARLSRWLCKYCPEVGTAHEYIIVDGWKYKSAHVICIGKHLHSNKWFCFNVSQYLEADNFEGILQQFKDKALTSYGKYNNLVWFKLR